MALDSKIAKCNNLDRDFTFGGNWKHMVNKEENKKKLQDAHNALIGKLDRFTEAAMACAQASPIKAPQSGTAPPSS